MRRMAQISPVKLRFAIYLTFLSNPESLRDPGEVERLEKQVTDATDLLEQAKARAALRRAMMLDPETYEQAFIEHAKEWAEANDVPAEVFEDMGVRTDVLEAAGLIGRARRGPRRGARRAAPTTTRPAGAPRRASVRADALEEGILGLTYPFSVRDVSENVGGSTITVTKAIRASGSAGQDQGRRRASQRAGASQQGVVCCCVVLLDTRSEA